MIKVFEENKLYSFESKFKVELKATFYNLLFLFLKNRENVLLIKYNHSNTYQKLLDIVSAEKLSENVIDNFKLIQIELYNKSLMATFDIIKQLGASADKIFIEKPNVENGYKFFDFLRELNKSVYVLPDVVNGELSRHSDYVVKIDRVSNRESAENFVLSCESENTKQNYDITFINHCLLKLKDNI